MSGVVGGHPPKFQFDRREEMKKKNFGALCGVTAASVLVAGWVVANRPATESSDYDGTVLFPSLLEDVDALDTIAVRTKDGIATLKSTESGWVFVERDNYPVQSNKIGELVVKLTRLTKVEPKTSLKDRYDRLDLLDPEDKEDTRAKEVTLTDVDGEELARLLVGKRKFTLGTSEGGTYVLLPDGPQAWLVTGELNPGARARDWLVREIINIKADDIRRIEIIHPDGEVLAASKNTPDQLNYTVEEIPAGMELRRDSIADDMGRVLSNLLLDDVKKAGAVEFSSATTIKATFEGFDGFTVVVELIEDEEENWLRFKGIAPSDNSGSDTSSWDETIASLNETTAGWVYQLPGYEVSAIKKRMAEMVRKPDEGA